MCHNDKRYTSCFKGYVGIIVIVNPQRLQGQSHITKRTNIEMLIKLLFCILIPIIRGDRDPMRGLANMFNDWDESQLFIFYEPKPQRSSKFQNPDCFAFQLTFTFAYTSSSCFMNLEKIIAMVLNDEAQESIMERILSGNDMKSTVDKFVVCRVIIWSFS